MGWGELIARQMTMTSKLTGEQGDSSFARKHSELIFCSQLNYPCSLMTDD